jgi:hypothetical protein
MRIGISMADEHVDVVAYDYVYYCSAAAVVRLQYAGMLRSVDSFYNGSKVGCSCSLEALATRLLQRAFESLLSGFSVCYCRVLTDKRVTNQTMPGVSLLRWYLQPNSDLQTS